MISRIAKPVPPEVMMRFNRSVSVHAFTLDWIAETLSGTMWREATDQVSGDSEKISFRVGPDRSVDASCDAVSET